MASTIDSYQGEIFQLYIVQRKTLDQVREILRREKGVNYSRKLLNIKTRDWGYWKKYKRSEHLAMLREKSARDSEGKCSVFTRQGRPVNIDRVQAYSERERLHLTMKAPFSRSTLQLSKEIVCRTPPPNLQQGMPFIQHWRATEKFLYDSDVLIKRSFETGLWCFDGEHNLIRSSPAQEAELTSLNGFLANLRIGCAAAHNKNFTLAGRHWRRASLAIEELVEGQYHDILPNFVKQISDVYSQGFRDVAKLLRDHMASFSATRAPQASMSSALVSLGQIDVAIMVDVEQRLMRHFTKVFELYLGPLCYNSFVMMIETARRRMLQDTWSTFEDHLPSLSYLDGVFGASDRRPLDVIALRLEILDIRGIYVQVEIEASNLILRARMIRGDEWQRHYHLTQGWYYLGCAQYHSQKYNLALDSLTSFLESEAELSKLDSFGIFKAKKSVVEQYLDELKINRAL